MRLLAWAAAISRHCICLPSKWPTWRPVFSRRWSIAWLAKPCWPCAKRASRRLCVGGGVAANRLFREQLRRPCKRGMELHVAPLELCTDNAVMGAIAVERLKAGAVESLDLDIQPGLVRPQ